MIVVSGKYRKEGDKFIIKVDLAWNEGWVASDHAVLQIGRRQAAYRKRSIFLSRRPVMRASLILKEQ
jgi:hypothetical protein